MNVESLTDMAKRYLQEWIVTNELQPGQQIKEDEIASRLKISRPPVREAFKALESEGLVVRKPRKGVFVVEMSIDDVIEVYMLKASLYSLATELALKHITTRQINELFEMVRKMEACIHGEDSDVLSYQKLHERFHVRIMNIGGNRRLKLVASNLHKQIQRFSYQTLKHKDQLILSAGFHKEIVDKMQQGDEVKACAVMKEHVHNAMNFLINIPGLFDR